MANANKFMFKDFGFTLDEIKNTIERIRENGETLCGYDFPIDFENGTTDKYIDSQADLANDIRSLDNICAILETLAKQVYGDK